MRPPVLHLCLLLLTLFFGAESRALGRMSDGPKTAVPDFFAEVLTRAGSPASGTEERAGETASRSGNFAPDVEDGPNLYSYVSQNPWSKFDPEGLATQKELRSELNELVDRKQGNLAILKQIQNKQDSGHGDAGDDAAKAEAID